MTEACKEKYEENKEHLLEVVMMKHLKGKSGSVIHGGRSLNMIFNVDEDDPLYRKSSDWDIYNEKPEPTSKRLSSQINKRTGCKAVSYTCATIPNVSGRENGSVSKYLCRIGEEPPNETDIDVMESPEDLKTTRKSGIYHESLEGQLEKAKKSQYVPMRSFKAGLDRRRIEKYMMSKGKQQVSSMGSFKPYFNQRSVTKTNIKSIGIIEPKRSFKSFKIIKVGIV